MFTTIKGMKQVCIFKILIFTTQEFHSYTGELDRVGNRLRSKFMVNGKIIEMFTKSHKN